MINDWLGGMTLNDIALKHGVQVVEVVRVIRAEWGCLG